jgi:type III secretion protein J
MSLDIMIKVSYFPGRVPAWLTVVAILLILTGCKVELYRTDTEQEANEMMAILLMSDIASDRIPGEENTWIVRAEKKELARAVMLLKDHGYPKQKYENMGQVFKKEGLVTSPLEDRIRFIYALSQELSQTLSCIDGVLTARVHVVLPENNPNSYDDVIKPSSATVFIKHREDVDFTLKIPKIKEMVVNSIEGLEYERVTVNLFPMRPTVLSSPNHVTLPVAKALGRLKMAWVILAFLLIATLAFCGYIFRLSKLTVADLIQRSKTALKLPF